MEEILAEDIQVGRYSKLKMEKIKYAKEYIKTLPKKNILFAGISGSVSYEPAQEDDVDIFIITRRNHLWSVILKAMIVRRISDKKDICLSLLLDSKYALQLYSSGLSELMARDALHVIPVYGSEYYNELLQNIPGFSSSGSRTNSIRYTGSTRRFSFPDPFDVLSFIFFAPFIFLKSIRRSHLDQKVLGNEGAFETKISHKYFYYNSEKYKKRSRTLTGG
jgi:hypothetical protein